MRRVVVVIAFVAALVAAAPAPPAAAWAPAATAPIHPGVQTLTAGSQCTANFVFTNGSDVLIGQAAHCAGTGGPTETNGCLAGTHPLGTQVQIGGATRPGTLVYSSWIAMKDVNEQNNNACKYNDFALVRVDPADVGRVNPSIPRWGGPTGIATRTQPSLARVFSFGNSSLRFGLQKLSPKVGVHLGTVGGGHAHRVYLALPGIPGDSGSGVLDASGRALGVLSTVGLTPLPLSNNFADLGRAVAYARAHGMPGLTLVPGTLPFKGQLTGLVIRR